MTSLGALATEACRREATAPKPGNVSPGCSFANMTYADMIASAEAIGPVFDRAQELTVGEIVLHSVREINHTVGKNTYLGTMLLFAPIARAVVRKANKSPIHASIAEVLRELTPRDAEQVYAAICESQPGGLGNEASHDVRGTPPDDLLVAMRQVADRDLIARQYVTDFAELFTVGLPLLDAANRRMPDPDDAVVLLHVQLMARYPDSLIARKLGQAIARESADRAARVLQCIGIGQDEYHRELHELDRWLRADGHRRNPGTTADLVAAILFIDSILSAGLAFLENE